MGFPRLLCTISLVLGFGSTSLAQQFPLRKLTVEDGLGHSIVYRTTQTSDGYLWFSTDNGLTRYDGEAFRNFTTDDGLPSNFIFDVAEWNGKMFISTLGGGIVTYENEAFEPAFAPSANPPAHPVEIRVSEGVFLVIDRFKDLFMLKNGKFKQVTAEDLGLEPDSSLDVFNVEIDDGVAYIATNVGLYTLAKGSFSEVELRTHLQRFVHRLITIDGSRVILVISDHLVEYDLRTHEYSVLFQGEVLARFTRVKQDYQGNIWLSTVNGNVYLFTPSETGYHKLHLFDDIVINDIFEDREKNLWLSTYGEGIWLIQSTRVRNHPIKGYVVADLGFDPERKDFLVTTMNAGLKVFHLEQNHFLSERENNRFEPVFANEIFLGPVTVTNDNIILGASHTLAVLRGNRARTLEMNKPITAIHVQQQRNRIWIGCRFALSYSDSSFQKLVPVAGFENTVARAIEELPDGRILIGTDTGVLLEDGAGFKQFPSEPALKTAVVNTLFYDQHSEILWAGTSSGLAWVKDGKLTLVDDPLTRVRCNSIASDDAGKIFVGSVRGLIHYDGTRFEVLSTKEGLPQANIIRVQYHATEKVLTLLSSNSISTIDTEYFPEILHFELPDILVENISTEDERHAFTGNTVEFKTTTKQLNVKLSTPQIRNRDKVAFRYRVNGKAWTSFNGNEIVLHSLPTGTMNITVQSHKINDESRSRTLQLSFYIPPPFYMKWWFIALMLIATGLLFSLMVVYYSRKKNQKLLDENRRLDVEHKALRNLLNPHFLSNAINSIHAFILQNDQRQTLGYLSKFSQLVRLNLELLSSDHVTLDKEIKNISLYLEFEKLRFSDKLNYTIDIDPEVPQMDTQVPSFILQPFVENAIWHGLLPREEGGNLVLQVQRQNRTVVIIIEDNGIGIKQSLRYPKAEIDKKTSMGINIIYERFELLKKVDTRYHLDITDKSDLNGSVRGTGTIITITIPSRINQNL
jgi:ligand-binding sensor domain-containing protein